MKNIFQIIILLLLSNFSFALEKSDFIIPEDDIVKWGCKISEKLTAISSQALMLYKDTEIFKKTPYFPMPIEKFHISISYEGDEATAYYYEFKNISDANIASGLIKGLIWGDEGQSIEHPERYYKFNNYIIIVSSKTIHKLDQLVFRSILFSSIPDSVIEQIKKRIKDTGEDNISPSFALNRLLQSKVSTIEKGGPYFGQSWELDEQGNIEKQFYEFLIIGQTDQGLAGCYSPIEPENKNEETIILDILDKAKNKLKFNLPEDFKSLIDSFYKDSSQGLIFRHGNTYITNNKSSNVALIKKVKDGYVILVAPENFTGKPEPCIIAFFWT